MSGLFSLAELDLSDHDRLAGCRLQRLEVLNWGTFDSRAWVFDVAGRNALLTGDIGSGKSTLVDAVTTLLLPAQRISYNKAAGADTRERTLRSYVQGHYKSERNEETGSSRPVALRDATKYSVILACFGNEDYESTTTLAQVFWTKNSSQGQPDRFFVVADEPLTIAGAFAAFGADIGALRRRLRAFGARDYSHFPEYGRDFRRRLGIDSEQAMELFHQTVSMKAVDNLNDFVRSHMLEPFDARSQIAALIAHFDDLSRTHEAVVRAKAQLELLRPLVAELDAYEQARQLIGALVTQRAALPFFFAEHQVRLLRERQTEAERRLAALAGDHRQATRDQVGLREAESSLSVQIAGQGGDRIAQLESEMERLERDRTIRQRRFDRFNALLADAGLAPLTEVDQFAQRRDEVQVRRRTAAEREAEVDNLATEHRVRLRGLDEDASQINAELRSLRSRPSNLPAVSIQLRSRLAADLRLDEAQLPYAGELIKVRDDAAEWEGAAERVLRSFGQSLLVPSEHYEQVAGWVDAHHLGARLVYLRVPATAAPPGPRPGRGSVRVLSDCLELKPDTGFERWLRAEVGRRADHACVESPADFRGNLRAVTRAGQVKDRDRHEKDDRRAIDDRRGYVLGWSSAAKIDALLEEATRLHRALSATKETLDQLDEARSGVRQQVFALTSLDVDYTSVTEIDWAANVTGVGRCRAELAAIRESSDVLATLTQQRDELRGQIARHDDHITALVDHRARLNAERERTEAGLVAAGSRLADQEALDRLRPSYPAVEELLAKVWGPLTDPDQVERAENDLARALTERVDAAVVKQNQATGRAQRQMSAFRTSYPVETAELDDAIESGPEYRDLLQQVERDDLPRFEAEFKTYLNQNAIREIAGFLAQLKKQEQLIRERVETINDSLTSIDFNPDRYIRLVPDRTPNMEVREFITDLVACTDDIVGDRQGDQYSEQKFLQVKRLIDRFKGREQLSETDRTWTNRVTDVRNWFVFSASERWRHDDGEYENYTDSGGKSGGQKEKLAYTILAASLAYQFKLDWGAAKSKAFRFVVIDEAFGRGSEESTRFALRLFTRLGLQLFIVTPLQKIHVIEPYVSTVGYVDNVHGDFSRLQRLTIEEYRLLRAERALGRAERAEG
jgi:uncharacterized protein YPO0396